MRPQDLQWCLRRKIENSTLHAKQRCTRASGIQVVGVRACNVNSGNVERVSSRIDIDKSLAIYNIQCQVNTEN